MEALFTPEEVEKLKHNPNVLEISQDHISFSPVFIYKAYKEKNSGKSLKEILTENGIDPDMLEGDKINRFIPEFETDFSKIRSRKPFLPDCPGWRNPFPPRKLKESDIIRVEASSLDKIGEAYEEALKIAREDGNKNKEIVIGVLVDIEDFDFLNSSAEDEEAEKTSKSAEPDSSNSDE